MERGAIRFLEIGILPAARSFRERNFQAFTSGYWLVAASSHRKELGNEDLLSVSVGVFVEQKF
jgi:hypothetical protein